MIVHGNEYVSAGSDKELRWLKEELEERFEIQTQVLGHLHRDRAEGKVLNMVMRACSDGCEIETDPRHAELMVEQTGVKDGQGGFDSRSTLQKR